MSTATFEDIFRVAVENQDIPGAVLAATNKSGTLNYLKAFGKAGVSPDSKPLTPESTFWIASCTKLLTTIACLQCVERGLFSLDSPENVAELLPEYAEPEVLTGLDDQGEVILERAKNRITLRHLLNHTSGMFYNIANPKLAEAWRKKDGENRTDIWTIERYRTPLIFEPGEGWEYGTGLDWAGKMVERANGHMSLEDYMQQHIWDPLGLQNLTFRLEKKEGIRQNLADMSARVPETGLLVPSASHIIVGQVKDDLGGLGLYGDAKDYLMILASILRDDGILLESASVEEMLRPQLTGTSQDSFMRFPSPKSMDSTTPRSWALGGLCTLADMDGRRKKGSLAWAGLPNLFWWIDREGGVAGFYASQVIPPDDQKTAEVFSEFEKGVYDMAEELK